MAGIIGAVLVGDMTGELPGTELVIYPFPLRSDCVVKLCLPKDLTRDEAEKLVKMVTALVMPENTEP